MIKMRISYGWLLSICFSGTQLCAFPQAVNALAALRIRAHNLKNLVAQEYEKEGIIRKVTLSISDFGASGDLYLGYCGAIPCTRYRHIFLNSMLEREQISVQNASILHELSHAYDPFAYSSKYSGFKGIQTQYPHLKQSVEAYAAQILLSGKGVTDEEIAGIDPREWHADWNATRLIKKHMPGDIEDLIMCYKINNAFGRGDAPGYAPLSVRLNWLQEDHSLIIAQYMDSIKNHR